MTPAPAAPRRYPYVQALRAAAAMSVAFDHVAHDLLAASAGRTGAGLALLAAAWNALPWKAGVDVFFVISGFVIVHATRPLFGTAAGPRRFLLRRLARIVPLYWAATTLFLALLLLAPGAVHAALGGPGYILSSYLFIPARRPDGLVEPVFGLGWTLDFEMLFYVVLTPFVRLPRPAAALGAALALAALVGARRAGLVGGVVLGTWADPIVFEFCAGMGLALLAGRVSLGRAARLVVVLAAVALLAADPALPRVLGWGLPAVLLVAAATLGRTERRGGFERLLERLGDASYALYLVHPFVMRPATIVWRRLAVHGAAPLVLAYAFVELAAAQAAALLVHRHAERPVTRWLRRRLEGGGAR